MDSPISKNFAVNALLNTELKVHSSLKQNRRNSKSLEFKALKHLADLSLFGRSLFCECFFDCGFKSINSDVFG